MRLRMPLIGSGQPHDPWRPKYYIPEFHFFYEGQEVVSDQVQPHYSLPNLTADITLPEDMGKRLLSKFGIEAGGDVELVSDETCEEGWKRGLELRRKALEEAQEAKTRDQIRF